MNPLAITGSAALLGELSPFIPDELINSLLAGTRSRGRPREFSAAQLYRVSLLALLTPAHSFNLLVHLLPENKHWRSFAHLRNKRTVPDAKMLHNFRDRMGVRALRQINEHLLRPLLDSLDAVAKTVALIDATDLPAATSAFKKSSRANIQRSTPAWEVGASKRVRVGGSLVTRSTHSVCGCEPVSKR